MPATRASMRKIREILRLHFALERSHREIARSVSVGRSTVSEYVTRAKAAGLCWPLPEDLDDTRLEALLFPSQTTTAPSRISPDFEHIHKELRRKGVTLMLLWQEYRLDHPEDGYQYSQFCELYKAYVGRLDVVLRQHHRAGEKLFVDYSGDGIPITDRTTGEKTVAQLFVATLGASNYTYAEVTRTQQLHDWIGSHIRTFEYFGGVPEITIPDNLKTGVKSPCRYDPELNFTYGEMAVHYDTAVIPARIRKPRDKGKVESAVLIAQRWILAQLRNHTFFSIEEANEEIRAKLKELNDRPFKKLAGSRRELFETLDRPALKPLPAIRYEIAEWSRPKVNIDYHIEVQKHYYSVPYQLIHERVDARLTSHTLEILFKGQRVASHQRSMCRGGHTTMREHMPTSHQKLTEWTPERLLRWAGEVGAGTAQLCEQIMATRAHPQQGFRACLGVIRLGKAYGDERLEAACNRALAIGSCSYRCVKSILKANLDKQPLADADNDAPPPGPHGNIRGEGYYH